MFSADWFAAFPCKELPAVAKTSSTSVKGCKKKRKYLKEATCSSTGNIVVLIGLSTVMCIFRNLVKNIVFTARMYFTFNILVGFCRICPFKST